MSLVIFLQLLNGLAVVPVGARPRVINLLLLAFPLTLILLAIGRDLGPLPSLRKEASTLLGQMIVASFIGLVLIIACMVIDRGLGGLIGLPFETYETWTQVDDADVRGDQGAVVALWVLIAANAAAVEEAVYKALFIRSFTRPPSKFVFVALTSFLFMAVHIEYGRVWTLLVGLAYGVSSAIYYYEPDTLVRSSSCTFSWT